MNYVLANKEKAIKAGFSGIIHEEVNGLLILTEKEVLSSVKLSGTIDERLAAIGGKIVSGKEIQM